jgi:hypothetical membrane protein
MPAPTPTDTAHRRPAPGPVLPRWALAVSVLAPLGMIGGFTLAAARQGPGFDPLRETISALATQSAALPWIMTAGLALTGVGHLATAAALRPAATPGRLLLATGGLATCVVAAQPIDVYPPVHAVAAAVGFAALALWPAASARRGGSGVLSRRAGVTAAGALLALTAWFVVELLDGGDAPGLAERATAGAEALWPLAVVLALRARVVRAR